MRVAEITQGEEQGTLQGLKFGQQKRSLHSQPVDKEKTVKVSGVSGEEKSLRKQGESVDITEVTGTSDKSGRTEARIEWVAGV